jgi:iron complex transport system substrate-binding protein
MIFDRLPKSRWRKEIYILFTLAFIAILNGCGGQSRTPRPALRKITDMAGRKLEIPAEITSVFIDRHSVQMLYAFDTILPVNTVFRYTETEKKYLKRSFYENKPYVLEKSVEEIVRLNPDIVFYSMPITPEHIEEADLLQKKIQIPVIMMDVDIFKYKDILAFMGDLLDRKEKADELIGFVEKYIDPIFEKGKTIPEEAKKSVYYAEGMKGLNTDPLGSVHSLLIDLVGGVNVAQVQVLPMKGMTNVSLEQIYTWNPDIILVWSGNFDGMDSYREIKSAASWQNLQAVRNNRVYQVPWRPFGWIDRPPGINRLIGVIWLSNLLYPEIYNHENIIPVTKAFFKKFHHYDLTDEEVREMINPQPE